MQWLNAKEVKPDKDGKYIVCVENYVNDTKIVSVCDYAKDLYTVDRLWFNYVKHLEDKSGFYVCDSHQYFDITSNVAYWMPLPEPPKE